MYWDYFVGFFRISGFSRIFKILRWDSFRIVRGSFCIFRIFQDFMDSWRFSGIPSGFWRIPLDLLSKFEDSLGFSLDSMRFFQNFERILWYFQDFLGFLNIRWDSFRIFKESFEIFWISQDSFGISLGFNRILSGFFTIFQDSLGFYEILSEYLKNPSEIFRIYHNFPGFSGFFGIL